MCSDNPILRPAVKLRRISFRERFADFLTAAFINAVAAVETQLLSQETLAARLRRSLDRCYLRSVKINVHLRLALKQSRARDCVGVEPALPAYAAGTLP